MSIRPVPEEFHTITAHLTVRDAAKAINFYREAFGARELLRNMAGDGKAIAHAELLLGDSRFFVNDEFPSAGTLAPRTERRASVVLHLYVENADAVFDKAGRRRLDARARRQRTHAPVPAGSFAIAHPHPP